MFRAGLVFILFSMILSAEEFVLVTHPKNPIERLTAEEARMIYLKKRRFWDDMKLVAINLPPQNSLRKHFESKILKMDPTQIDHYWIKQHYKGHRPPYRVESVESMILFIKKVEGAIGYLPKSRVDQDLKVIYEEGAS